MGLDMFLETEHKVTGETSIIHSWRKANQIREWFVTRFDCDPEDQLNIVITQNDIDCLIDAIKQVLDYPELAPSVLPTASGFFFGSTEYDNAYFSELSETLNYLTKDFEYEAQSEKLRYTEWW